MYAAHKENKVSDFFPLRNKLFMPNMKNGTILDTEKNKIDLGDSPPSTAQTRHLRDLKFYMEVRVVGTLGCAKAIFDISSLSRFIRKS